MREALGPDMDIMIDINQGYNADVAINQGRKIVDYDIYWLEEPVPADDFKGYMRVAQALPIRIVGGETHFTRFDLRPFFENPCCPILQPDPMRGGFTDLRKISVLADTWNIPMAPHLFPELNVQLLASIPNGALDRGHGPVRRPVRRSGADRERHDHRAGAARAWARVQAGDFEGLQGVDRDQRIRLGLASRRPRLMGRATRQQGVDCPRYIATPLTTGRFGSA